MTIKTIPRLPFSLFDISILKKGGRGTFTNFMYLRVFLSTVILCDIGRKSVFGNSATKCNSVWDECWSRVEVLCVSWNCKGICNFIWIYFFVKYSFVLANSFSKSLCFEYKVCAKILKTKYKCVPFSYLYFIYMIIKLYLFSIKSAFIEEYKLKLRHETVFVYMKKNTLY